MHIKESKNGAPVRSPLITIGLTSYNHAEFICDSIESILNQTYSNFELVIIDDASTDGSQAIIKEYAAQDDRIRVFINPYNMGRSLFYDMLDECNGEYIAIAHSDDKWALDKLEKQVQYLETHPDIEACFTNVRIIDDNNDEVFQGDYAETFKINNWDRFQWLRHFFLNGNAFCHPSLLIHKRAYYNYSLVSRGLSGLPDMCSWIRLLTYKNIKVLEEKLTFFRVHKDGSNVSGNNLFSNRRVETEFCFVLDEFRVIDNPEDLVRIFPESQKYIVGKECVPAFLLAMMAIELGQKPQHRLFGLKLLYEIQNNIHDARKAERLYGFGRHEFNTLKFENEVFPMPMLKTMRVYYASESECYSEDRVLMRCYQLGSSNTASLSLSFNLSSLAVKSIRIDPIEGEFVRAKIISTLVDGKPVRVIATNALICDSDGYDIFLTRDPIYEFGSFSVPVSSLIINMEVRILDSLDLTDLQENLCSNTNRASFTVMGKLRKKIQQKNNKKQ